MSLHGHVNVVVNSPMKQQMITIVFTGLPDEFRPFAIVILT